MSLHVVLRGLASFAAALVCFASSRLAATSTFTDNFTTPVNYLTNGVAGTIWDGIYLGAGEIANATSVAAAAGSVSVADADISGNHVLTIASLQTDWENTADDGVFLFKVITGDFDMSLHVIGPIDTGTYNLPGLMVRAFGPGGSPAPNATENSLVWGRFDEFSVANMSKNNVNGGKTDTAGGTYPNTNYWLRIQRVGTAFNLYEKALETDPWQQVGSVTRADFSGVPLQVGIEHSDYAGGATRTAQYEKFSLIASNLGPLVTLPAPATGLTMTSNAGGMVLSWTPGTGSAGSLAAVWTGSSVMKEAPASGFTYSGNAAYGFGDTLPTTNYYVVYSGSGTHVTVTNLVAGTTYNVAVFASAGTGTNTVYTHGPTTGSFTLQGPAPGLFRAWAAVQGADVAITFNTTNAMWYQVQFTDSLSPTNWQNVGYAPQLATGLTMTCVHTGGFSSTQRFYRVQQFATPAPTGRNLSWAATPTTSYVSSWETLAAIDDGYVPSNSADHSHGAYGNWPSTGTQWVEYDWSVPINTAMVDVYWWQDNQGIYAPASCSLQYWNGTSFLPVSNPSGLGVALNQFNTTTFTPVTTTGLRLLFQSDALGHSTGILEWRVYDAGGSPTFPPLVNAGVDRDVIVGGNTYLNGAVQADPTVLATPIVTWSQSSGPGNVAFGNSNALTTTASFSAPGAAVLQLAAYDGQHSGTGTLNVVVAPPPPATHPLPLYVSPYTINSRLWTYRLNRTLTNWIPHLYAELNNPSNSVGNINSFIQASNKLAGLSYTVPGADPWADAYTLNTVESMCYALMYDPQGDSNIINAQATFRTNLNYWIPIILGAQESDGYLHTYTTLRGLARWSNNSLHEGYVGGYFIEASLAHYLMSGRTNAILYNAAKKLADCWCNNIGPAPKKTWYDGHENMEQALVHLGRFMNEFEGPTNGQKYIDLAKFLMDSRGNGSTYDQSQAPVIQQYEVVGHAVRAEYLYSGIEDVAIETGNIDYQSAGLSLWDNFVNKKYYVQGGAGSGETAEGFGNNYSLPNSAYCETCAGCGTLFFFQKMNLGYQDAKYADLMENVLYNEILGSLDDSANNIFYPNPLNSSAARESWTGVPCCYGNASRTLFQMPTWIYTRSSNTIYVNQFIGSTITVSNISGTTVQMVQITDYPWTNSVSIVVNPSAATNFTVFIRVPNRTMSALYTPTPAVSGLTSLQVNGTTINPTITNGYATITRTWTSGDRIDLVLPMVIQRIKASSQVAADVGLVSLQFGPLIYNVESADQNTGLILSPSAPMSVQYTNILGGFMKITGTWTNGAALTAIPNYARLNRGGSSAVWFRDQ